MSTSQWLFIAQFPIAVIGSKSDYTTIRCYLWILDFVVTSVKKANEDYSAH